MSTSQQLSRRLGERSELMKNQPPIQVDSDPKSKIGERAETDDSQKGFHCVIPFLSCSAPINETLGERKLLLIPIHQRKPPRPIQLPGISFRHDLGQWFAIAIRIQSCSRLISENDFLARATMILARIANWKVSVAPEERPLRVFESATLEIDIAGSTAAHFEFLLSLHNSAYIWQADCVQCVCVD